MKLRNDPIIVVETLVGQNISKKKKHKTKPLEKKTKHNLGAICTTMKNIHTFKGIQMQDP
jgi:hypothetical protein